MRKYRIILLITMIMLVACTCTVMGASQTGEGKFRNKDYSKSYNGDRTIFCAAGNSTKSYTTIYYSHTSSCHMDALVRGYNNYDGEILGQAYNSGTKAVGEMVHSGYLDRDDSNVWYYYEHKANCYLSPYQMYEVIDTYKYTAKQND